MDKKIEKKYYTISEVAKMLDVAPSLIRFWESQFEEIKPRKNKNGVRQYTQADIQKLNSIYILVKKKGYTLQGAREILQSKGESINDTLQIIDELEHIKAFLLQLKEKLGAND